MGEFKATCALGMALILGCVPTGCATYRKCGFDGCRLDADLSAEVRAQLNRHAEFQGANSVYVQTLNRVVYLDGLVDTPSQRRTAESIALQVPGVARVVDMIAISNAR